MLKKHWDRIKAPFIIFLISFWIAAISLQNHSPALWVWATSVTVMTFNRWLLSVIWYCQKQCWIGVSCCWLTVSKMVWTYICIFSRIKVSSTFWNLSTPCIFLLLITWKFVKFHFIHMTMFYNSVRVAAVIITDANTATVTHYCFWNRHKNAEKLLANLIM